MSDTPQYPSLIYTSPDSTAPISNSSLDPTKVSAVNPDTSLASATSDTPVSTSDTSVIAPSSVSPVVPTDQLPPSLSASSDKSTSGYAASFTRYLASLNLQQTKSVDSYKSILSDLLHLNILADPHTHNLESYLAESDILTAPASSRFHGSYRSGLIQHSLLTAFHLVRLLVSDPVLIRQYPVSLSELPSFENPDSFFVKLAFFTGFFHDFCKLNSYQISTRSKKNEKGNWEQVPYYAVRDDYQPLGHGIESCHRVLQIFPHWLNPVYKPAIEAIRWHMGAFDLTDSDQHGYHAAIENNPWVLGLQIADMKSAYWDKA